MFTSRRSVWSQGPRPEGDAQAQAARRLALVAENPSALLCYERDPAHCHRTLLLDAVGESVNVVDLYVA